ncbi:thiamine pyrophosphate-binding protein [Rhodopseudomonas palustris]
MPISVSDYVFEKVADKGVRDIFFVSGGWIMYLTDAVYRNSKLNGIVNYHEQACAIAAEAYARVTENIGVCLVTAGPGSTNALTGVAGAFVDSIPMLVISGQVRTGIMADYSFQRQVGPQEINIQPMAEPVVKYIATPMRAEDVRYELEKCLHLAVTGRPGPVWLNIPLDLQNAMIEPDKLQGYDPVSPSVSSAPEDQLEAVAAMLRKAKRPVIIGGNGVVLAGARHEFRAMVEKLKIPTMLTISAMDLLPENFPLFQGRGGPGGQRRANFALQNADLVLAIGTSLSISCIGFNDRFAPKGEKILVNIDPGDLKRDNVKIEHPICCDAKEFIVRLSARFRDGEYAPSRRWIEACAEWKRDYPLMLPDDITIKTCVDAYRFYEELSRLLGEDDIVLSGNSLDGCIIAYQAHRVKSKQRAFTSVCFGAMGWDLPALVGACAADRDRRGVLITGDGSFIFNVQELMTLKMYNLNAKIFISNNDGYASIRGTQSRFCGGRFIGVDADSGVGNPDFRLLAQAFGLNYVRIETNEQLESGIQQALADKGPCIIDMKVSKEQQRFRASSYKREDGTVASRPIEDMDPLLSREELARIMTMFDEEPADAG